MLQDTCENLHLQFILFPHRYNISDESPDEATNIGVNAQKQKKHSLCVSSYHVVFVLAAWRTIKRPVQSPVPRKQWSHTMRRSHTSPQLLTHNNRTQAHSEHTMVVFPRRAHIRSWPEAAAQLKEIRRYFLSMEAAAKEERRGNRPKQPQSSLLLSRSNHKYWLRCCR